MSLTGDDKRFYERLEQKYNATENENIRKNIKPCMDYVYEQGSPSHGGEVMWAMDGKAHMCSIEAHGELWVTDLKERENK